MHRVYSTSAHICHTGVASSTPLFNTPEMPSFCLHHPCKSVVITHARVLGEMPSSIVVYFIYVLYLHVIYLSE
jgi:hypothetical protein